MDVFHCYEFLLMKKYQEDLSFWDELKSEATSCWNLEIMQDILLNSNVPKKLTGSDNETVVYNKISADLWFLTVALEKSPHRLLNFLRAELRLKKRDIKFFSQSVLERYLSCNNFVEMHLDCIFKYGETANLPRELFRCKNVRVLSLRCNNLECIPPDIGRLSNLEELYLTNNRLQNRSIPLTLTFCRRLTQLYLDNNLLDALPGFLLDMPQLSTVHRHGNHNYFKATFMWYHTDVNDRVLHVGGDKKKCHKPNGTWSADSLLSLSARAVLASKTNFLESGALPSTIQDYVSDSYPKYNVCGYCPTALPHSLPGYKVFTFKNPYLGNTCVPFQHWACSRECAEAIEVPAHLEQARAAERMDREYNHYIKEFESSMVSLQPRGDSCILL